MALLAVFIILTHIAKIDKEPIVSINE